LFAPDVILCENRVSSEQRVSSDQHWASSIQIFTVNPIQYSEKNYFQMFMLSRFLIFVPTFKFLHTFLGNVCNVVVHFGISPAKFILKSLTIIFFCSVIPSLETF